MNPPRLALEHVRGEVEAICQAGWRPPTTFVEQILEAFHGTAALASSGRPHPRQIAVVGKQAEIDPTAPRFVAFRAYDYVRAGGLDQAEMFRGDATSLT